MRIASVYCITNIINGKKYIGVSIDPEGRMNGHLKGKGSLLVGRSVQKYGKDYFKREILLVGLEAYCYDMEVKLIAELNTQQPNGFNIAPGGERPPSALGKKHSDATKLKLSKAATGRPGTRTGAVVSEETKKKIGIANSQKRGHKQSQETIAKRAETMRLKKENGWIKSDKGKSKSHKGKPFTEEHRKKLSDAKKGKSPWNKGLKSNTLT